jgi:hypothetical protein
MYYRRRRASVVGYLRAIDWRAEKAKEEIPGRLMNGGMQIEEDRFCGGGEKWKVFHASGDGTQGSDKVAIYWHGGAFFYGVH